jgi:hypothetical protein
MKHKLIILALILSVIVPFTLNAVSQSAVIFLTIEPGSHAGAMGAAFTAQAEDAFAAYWNTGALAFNRKTQFAGMHSNWFGAIFNDMYFEYLAWNQYFEDVGNIGLNFTYMTYGEQEGMDEDGHSTGSFRSYDLAAAASYAYQVSQNVGLGLSFKFILSDLAPENANETETESSAKGQGMSYAFDLGVKYKNVGIERLDFGWSLQNIGPNITYINESQSDQLPMNWRMGLSYRLFDTQYSKLTVNSDMSKVLADDTTDPVYTRIITAWDGDSPIYNIGAEYGYYNLLFLRAGYINDSAGDIIGASFGAGLEYTFSEQYRFSLDFAMQPAGGLTDYNQTFTARIEF